MTPAHLKTTMAALAVAATPPHLRAEPGIAMSAGPGSAPVAGAAPQGAAPRAAAGETIDWDNIVAGLNATLPNAATSHQGPASMGQETGAASGQKETGFSWDDVVADYNAANGLTPGGAR